MEMHKRSYQEIQDELDAQKRSLIRYQEAYRLKRVALKKARTEIVASSVFMASRKRFGEILRIAQWKPLGKKSRPDRHCQSDDCYYSGRDRVGEIFCFENYDKSFRLAFCDSCLIREDLEDVLKHHFNLDEEIGLDAHRLKCRDPTNKAQKGRLQMLTTKRSVILSWEGFVSFAKAIEWLPIGGENEICAVEACGNEARFHLGGAEVDQDFEEAASWAVCSNRCKTKVFEGAQESSLVRLDLNEILLFNPPLVLDHWALAPVIGEKPKTDSDE